MTKLTLSVDKSVVEKAKRFAEANNTSVSSMFSRFVMSLESAQSKGIEIAPLTRSVSGLASLPSDRDYKEILTDALMDKYGLNKGFYGQVFREVN